MPDRYSSVATRSDVTGAGALAAQRTYQWLTALWLTVMAASGLFLGLLVFGPMVTPQSTDGGLWMARDEADEVVGAFGPADEDRVIGVDVFDPVSGTRVMTYAGRHLRVTFVRRLRGTPPRSVWKLVGFAEADGRVALSGEEALRRLKSRR